MLQFLLYKHLSTCVSVAYGSRSRGGQTPDLPATREKIHHQRYMTKNLRFRKLLILIALSTPAWAGIVEDVRDALAQNSLSAAEAELNS